MSWLMTRTLWRAHPAVLVCLASFVFLKSEENNNTIDKNFHLEAGALLGLLYALFSGMSEFSSGRSSKGVSRITICQ
jgi:hypothetical protein